jgi:hypothetical protein
MDAFSYLSVLISIILGLAITQILQGIRGVVIHRRRLVMYWPSVAWAGLLLLINVQSWWAMYGMRNLQTWTFIAFAMVLLQVTVLYMLAALVLPDFSASERKDLKQHYFEQTRWFYGLAVFLLVVSVVKDVVLDGSLPNTTNLLFHLMFFVVWALAAFVKAESYHQWIPLVMIVSFGAYIALLFARL